jgi:hypothetical protein
MSYLWEATCLSGKGVKWQNGTNQPIEPPTDEKRASQTLPPPLHYGRRGVRPCELSEMLSNEANRTGLLGGSQNVTVSACWIQEVVQ